MLNPKYPNVKVPLVGLDGNAFAILGRVAKALREARVSNDEINLYMKQATGGDYNKLLATTARWVDVMPVGVEVVSLEDPERLHDAIARAVS